MIQSRSGDVDRKGKLLRFRATELKASSRAIHKRLDADRAASAETAGRSQRAPVSATDYAVITINTAGRVTGWNAGARRVFGWDEAEVLWQDAACIWTQEDCEAGVPEAERNAALTEGSVVGERWHMRRDGTRFWASGHLTPMDKAGHGGFLKILHDSGARGMADDALESRIARRARECDRAWQLSPNLLLVAWPDGRLVAVNPAWLTMLGWAEDELVGQSALSLTHPDDRDALRTELDRLAPGLPVRALLTRQRHRDGSWRWLTWTALPDNGLIYATGRDVTDEHTANPPLGIANERPHRSQRLEMLDELTDGLAHDFNNLLQGIGSNLDMLQLRLEQGRTTEAVHYVETAHQGVDRAAALTLGLLAFAHRH